MAAGCVPILTTSDGGASAGLRDGQSALFADARRDDAEPAVARALTEAVMRFLQADQYALARVAWAAAREHFALEHHLARCAAVIDNAASSPPRSWRADVPCAVSNAPATPAAGAGWAPPDAPDRLRRALDALAGRTILLHGAGRHTIDLAAVLARAPLTIAGLTDDDPQQHGRTLFGWTILDPARAAASGATDVIISSYIHREAIWSRRAVYERQGIRVHALYA
jgi:hypothetical protein